MYFKNTRTFLVLFFFLSITGKVFSQAPTADFSVLDPDGCAPHFAEFSSALSTGSGLSYVWDFGDGTGGSVLPDPSHNYDSAGVYTVTLTVTNANGTDTEVKTAYITVFKNPVAFYTLSDDTACSGSPITFYDGSTQGDGVINQYSWTFNDGNPAVVGVDTVTHSFINSTGGILAFVPVLLINDANGCNSGYSADTVFIFPALTANFGVASINSCTVPTVVTFSNSSTPNTAPSFWDFGDPGSGASNNSNLYTPQHTYTAAGSYLVTYVMGSQSCNAFDTMTIRIEQPVAAFIPSDTVVCRYDSVLFTNQSTPTGLVTSRWTFGDGSPVSFVTSPKHPYSIPGQYLTTLVTTFGNCTDTARFTIIVPNPPSLAFTTPDHIACDTPFTVTFNADTTSQNMGWFWDFGDPTSGVDNNATIRDPSHTYHNFGKYDITLIVTDTSGCRDTIELIEYVEIEKPVIQVSQAPDSGCVGDIFNYTATVTSNDPITNWTWDFGDGTPVVSTGTTPDTSHQFNIVGIFDVTVTITTQSGCTDTLVLDEFARVGNIPNAMIDSVLDTICFKGQISFTDLSTPPPITGWMWHFGDGQTSTEQNPTHKYEFDTSGVADPFDIYLIAYHNGCADSDTVYDMIAVLPPIPDFSISYNCINPDSVVFTNLSVGTDSFYWDFGDTTAIINDTSTADKYHIYQYAGVHTVTLTGVNLISGCRIDTTHIVETTHVSAIMVANPLQACYPGTIDFNSTDSSEDVSSWVWTFGEGIPFVRDTAINKDTLHTYANVGYYLVTLTTTDMHNCVQTDTQTVHIIGPHAGFTSTPLNGCAPNLLVQFNDTSHTEGGLVSQWEWKFGAGTPSQISLTDSVNWQHTFTNPGTYTVTLIVTDVNGCKDTASVAVNATQPTATIVIPDTVGCMGTSETFLGNAGLAAPPINYHWDFGDSDTLTTLSTSTSHTYAANGTYVVTLTVTDANGCTDNTSKTMLIYTTPAAFTVTAVDTCVEQNGIKKAVVNATFHSDSNLYVTNWHWNLINVLDQSIWPSPDFIYSYNVPPGTYDAELTVTNSIGCTSTVTQTGAVIVPGPTGSFSFAPDSGCSPLTVTFTGHSTNASLYAWDFGDGSVLNDTPDSIVTHTYTALGNSIPQFYLGFQLSNSFCYVPVPIYDTVKVNSLISVNILEDSIFVTEGIDDTMTVQITDPINLGPPYIYNWTPADHVTFGPLPQTFLASSTGHTEYFLVSVPYGNSGCSGIDSVRVVYFVCELATVIPNVFTPDGDFKNDTYHIDSLCTEENFNFRIFNRWGRIIYESTDPHFEWDGTTTGGSLASEGTYYYVLNSKRSELHGYIELIRNEK